MNKEPLPIGFPKNTRLGQDLAPVRELLKLNERADGNLCTDLIPNAIFRQRRVQDIARLMDGGELDIGFAADDILAEYVRPSRDIEKIRLNVGELVQLCLLIREEDREKFDEMVAISKLNPWKSMSMSWVDPKRFISNLALLTSYPNITEQELAMQYNYEELDGNTAKSTPLPPRSLLQSLNRASGERLVVRQVAGQTESMLRNRDVWNALGAVDIVRTGGTAARYQLMPYSEPIMDSRPVLARLRRRIPSARADDVFDQIRELLLPVSL